jgi:hypothetical protein
MAPRMKKGGAGIIWAVAFEGTPAAIFGGAVGFSIATVLAQPALDVAPLAGGAGAAGSAWLLLRRLGTPVRRLYVPEFELGSFERDFADLPPIKEEPIVAEPAVVEELEELLLDDAAEPFDEEELVLENPLPVAKDDSRVVQLFKREAPPTAGELQERIDYHLRTTPRPMPDATQELHDALAALRRSLR